MLKSILSYILKLFLKHKNFYFAIFIFSFMAFSFQKSFLNELLEKNTIYKQFQENTISGDFGKYEVKFENYDEDNVFAENNSEYNDLFTLTGNYLPHDYLDLQIEKYKKLQLKHKEIVNRKKEDHLKKSTGEKMKKGTKFAYMKPDYKSHVNSKKMKNKRNVNYSPKAFHHRNNSQGKKKAAKIDKFAYLKPNYRKNTTGSRVKTVDVKYKLKKLNDQKNVNEKVMTNKTVLKFKYTKLISRMYTKNRRMKGRDIKSSQENLIIPKNIHSTKFKANENVKFAYKKPVYIKNSSSGKLKNKNVQSRQLKVKFGENVRKPSRNKRIAKNENIINMKSNKISNKSARRKHPQHGRKKKLKNIKANFQGKNKTNWKLSENENMRKSQNYKRLEKKQDSMGTSEENPKKKLKKLENILMKL